MFKDQGISGTKEKEQRPGLDDLLRAIHRRKVDVVIVTKLDRLARSLKQLLALCDDIKDHGVDLVVLDQPVDTTTSAGKAYFGILGVFAEFERDLIIERTNAGLARARAEGTKSGKPFGRPRIGKDVEKAIREQLKRGSGVHLTAKLVKKALKLETLGSGTVQRVRASMRRHGRRHPEGGMVKNVMIVPSTINPPPRPRPRLPRRWS